MQGRSGENRMPADDKPRAIRKYVSPLRQSQVNRTRDLILDALTELLTTHHADEISTRQIAERAGVSQPTVYRHFPDRMALIEALATRIEKQDGAWLSTPPQTLEEWTTWIEHAFRIADVHPVEATAEAVLSADPRRASRSRRERSRDFLDLLARSLPDLDEQDVRRAAALLRVLGSVQTWLRMREEYGIDGADSGQLVTWSVRILAREIRAGHLPETPA